MKPPFRESFERIIFQICFKFPMAFPMAKQYSQKMKGFVDFELRCRCILPIPPYIGETKSEVFDSCPAPGSLCMGRVGSILLASASMAL